MNRKYNEEILNEVRATMESIKTERSKKEGKDKALLVPNRMNIFGGFNQMEIKVKVNAEHCTPVVNKKGDWIDLACKDEVVLNMGDFAIIDLGVCIELPKHMEAHLVARSSTFNKYGIIQTNCIGIIDNSYSGDNDVWGMPVLATRDIVIPKGTRIAQFRVFANQPSIDMKIVESMGNTDRGGFGSTGD